MRLTGMTIHVLEVFHHLRLRSPLIFSYTGEGASPIDLDRWCTYELFPDNRRPYPARPK